MASETQLVAWMDSVLTRPTASAEDIQRLLELATHDAAPIRAHAVDTLCATVEYFDLAPRLVELERSPEVEAGLVDILEELVESGWPKRPPPDDLAATGPRVVWQIAEHLDALKPLSATSQSRFDDLNQARP